MDEARGSGKSARSRKLNTHGCVHVESGTNGREKYQSRVIGQKEAVDIELPRVKYSGEHYTHLWKCHNETQYLRQLIRFFKKIAKDPPK